MPRGPCTFTNTDSSKQVPTTTIHMSHAFQNWTQEKASNLFSSLSSSSSRCRAKESSGPAAWGLAAAGRGRGTPCAPVGARDAAWDGLAGGPQWLDRGVQAAAAAATAWLRRRLTLVRGTGTRGAQGVEQVAAAMRMASGGEKLGWEWALLAAMAAAGRGGRCRRERQSEEETTRRRRRMERREARAARARSYGGAGHSAARGAELGRALAMAGRAPVHGCHDAISSNTWRASQCLTWRP